MTFILSNTNSVANNFLKELRDQSIQKDPMRFRRNVERMGEIMAYELSRKFEYKEEFVYTLLGKKKQNVMVTQPVLVTVLRAGLPYFNGFLNLFDHAECGFIGAYRQEGKDHITIKLEYLATPSLEGRVVILIDPMLATGRSVVDAVTAMKKHGSPLHVHVVSLVAAPEGMSYLEKNLNIPYSLWTCAVDERLDENFYIVPGLGDAGDLSYGVKI